MTLFIYFNQLRSDIVPQPLQIDFSPFIKGFLFCYTLKHYGFFTNKLMLFAKVSDILDNININK